MTWERQQPAWYTPPTLEKKTQAECFYHSWKPILLLNQTVYNCATCDKKKEDYEREQAEEAKKRTETKSDYPFW